MSSTPKPRKKPSNRRALSCYPCRRHKLKCDRRIPCQTCIRYRREDVCRQHPPSSAVLGPPSNPTPQRIAPAETLEHDLQVAQLVELGHNRRSWDIRQVIPCLMTRLSITTPFFPTRSVDPRTQWKVELVSLLPQRSQCDRLVSYYIDHIDIMYHAIHIPSFCRAYQDLWSTKVANVDLIWLGLLFIMISTSALLVPHSHVGELGLDIPRARDLANFWYEACRQAQFVGDYEAKPTLTQIQIFLCSQTYWLETKNYEVLNSQLGQMVRNAQALGLDKDKPGASIVETELRRRAFWELFVCDAYQALCLDRAPLLDSAPKIPKPIHCNDVDITENGIQERPSSEVTDMSANLAHYNVYVVLRKGFHDMSSYEKVQQIDEEIKAAVARFPWYFQLHDARNKSLFLDTVAWQYNILHMGICLLRIRISRPFMHAKIGEAWYVCANAAQDMLLPYRRMRQADPQGFLQSPKFVIQAYQAYTAAVAVAAFLLVDRALPNLPSESMFHDVEMVINDLDQSDLGPMLAGGVKVLRRMLHLFINNQSRDPQAREGIVTEIASVFGGEQHTRSYLKPRSPDSVPDSNAQAVTTAVGPQPLITNALPTPVTATTFAPQAWPISSLINMPEQAPEPAAFAPDIMNYPVALDFQTALDMLNCDQWFDFNMPTTLNEHATF